MNASPNANIGLTWGQSIVILVGGGLLISLGSSHRT